MTEMIERVAKAIELEMFKVQEFNSERGIVTPEQLARTAIEAMREPTEEMLLNCDSQLVHAEIIQIYNSLLDAALK